jgi:hypothetical protein
VIDRVFGRRAGDDRGGEGGGGLGLRPERVVVHEASFVASDAGAGIVARGGGVSFEARPGDELAVTVHDVEVEHDLGARATATIDVAVEPGDARRTLRATIRGGSLRPWRGFSLTGIEGTVRPDVRPGQARVELRGGYGGVEGTLWTATGWIAPDERSAFMDLKADRFTFDRLRPILEGSMVQDFDDTSVDVTMAIRVERGVGTFEGELGVQKLTVHHPMLAEAPVRDLGFAASVTGGFDLDRRSVSLTRADVDYHGVPAQVDAFAFLPGGVDADTGAPRTRPRVGGRLVIPRRPCQQVLEVLPRELTPHMQGFELLGKFSADIHVDIDWQDLQATKLYGSVGIWNCIVAKAPRAVDATRFMEPFKYTHADLPETPKSPATTKSYVIGLDNPDFVPLHDISIHMRNSVMTTEDSRFYEHKGFIPSEFRTALIKNLEAGRFKYGASSISMQMVKNVLLYRDKLLARKLQELFLTWYVETQLDKDRILEIYLNAIEFGPGIWGIGAATQHYFGKHPRDLTPAEAAFFSSILPGPKPRYIQYCRNKLSRYTAAKIPRILRKMYERNRLDDQQLALFEAGMMPVEFVYPDPFNPKACEKLIETYMPIPVEDVEEEEISDEE